MPAEAWMREVKRYNPVIYISERPTRMIEGGDGDYVKYSDYEKAIAERDAARQECERLVAGIDTASKVLIELQERKLTELREQVERQADTINAMAATCAKDKKEIETLRTECTACGVALCRDSKCYCSECGVRADQYDQAVALLRRWYALPKDELWNCPDSDTGDFLAAHDAESLKAEGR